MHIKIGTRGSKLALKQTHIIVDKLEREHPEHTFEIVIIKTKGDKNQTLSLKDIGGQGIFIKEIEHQLLNHTIDVAIHSMKDLPSTLSEGLILAKTWTREDARDALILRTATCLKDLRQGAIIATGSVRRANQLLKLRPDLHIVDIRGNVETRIQKMMDYNYDGIILAVAGLKRIQKEDIISEYLNYEDMLPSPTQGMLAIELREEDVELKDIFDFYSDEISHVESICERTFLKEMNVTCKDSIGAHATLDNGVITLTSMYGYQDTMDLYYAKEMGIDPIKVAKEAAKNIRKQMSGTVYLVGAGPGDPLMITLKAIQAIQEADCIIYDRLVANEILDYTKEDCEMIYAGKANHNHTLKQEEINQLMVNKSLQYKKVVRLKGGDVYVFGRGGEEALYLKEHGVSFEIINGISSCIAGPASAGIPITTREYASGFRVISAHNRKGEFAEIDFKSIANSKDTCIFLMGLSKLDEIVHNLLVNNMSKDTKIAVISNATTRNQRTCIATLDTIIDKVKEANIVSPALIVVGETVGLSAYLYDKKEEQVDTREFYIPKINKEVSNLAKQLRQNGKKVYEMQVGEIQYLNTSFEIESLYRTNYIIFTSKHGIDGFFTTLKKQHIDLRTFSTCTFVVVGNKTAKHLENYGIYPEIIGQTDSLSLLESLKTIIKKKDIVHYFKDDKVHTFENLLKEICDLHIYNVYKNEKVQHPKIILNEHACAVFTAASNVHRFMEIIKEEGKEKFIQKGTVYSIGNQTTKALLTYGFTNIKEAKLPSYDALVKRIMEVDYE